MSKTKKFSVGIVFFFGLRVTQKDLQLPVFSFSPPFRRCSINGLVKVFFINVLSIVTQEGCDQDRTY